ncbi:DNA-3-methyladenine glycosylase [Nitrosospira sp. Is2]|uniref:DNA-3-methyladenine glycosylase family protein n=1 Tax=Nitrosospira sp. Is2 TaxID=3080532 RepID=UPI002953C478|nr:DNA-3-methyladenine glycosylase [Nitrosospira sp. Is2]WON73438.1 DNA-3-methyladenine glycosylase [Nitrosospira sp. Is2]
MGTERLAELYPHAVSHLSSVDEDWSRLIKHVDPCMHRSKPAREPYEALIRAVAYQQLHARAADAIIARFLDLYSDSESEIVFPSPDEILATRTEDLRSCGFSSRKIATVQHIAEGALSGLVPSLEVASQMQDDELIARLIVLPGVGRWTVEMFLMHTLGRMDILPVDDFGIREGYRFLKSLNTLPNRKEMEKAGLPCSPYRTIASWYLWRVASLPEYARMSKKK